MTSGCQARRSGRAGSALDWSRRRFPCRRIRSRSGNRTSRSSCRHSRRQSCMSHRSRACSPCCRTRLSPRRRRQPQHHSWPRRCQCRHRRRIQSRSRLCCRRRGQGSCRPFSRRRQPQPRSRSRRGRRRFSLSPSRPSSPRRASTPFFRSTSRTAPRWSRSSPPRPSPS